MSDDVLVSEADLIILGAGAPHHGELPSALQEVQFGTPILRWQLDASGCSMTRTTFVAGYQSDLIRACYPELCVIENADWKETGSGASLLSAPLNSERKHLVCYSDILYRKSALTKLTASDADITVAWDSSWKHRYAGRSQKNLEGCEKVIVQGDQIIRLGADLSVDWADGEFVGLVMFQPDAMKHIERLRQQCPVSLIDRHLSDYIEYLRISGCTVAAIDLAGDWAECNESHDIAHFILGTKAETLGRLQSMLTHAEIQNQAVCTVEQWRVSSELVLSSVRKMFGDQTLIVRSSARSEDTFYDSNAGGYDSLLNVDPITGLAAAIEQVIASYGTATNDDQVLIQPMVSDVSVSGVAFTKTLEHGAPWYVINYETSGNTEAITSGNSKDHKTLFLRRDIEADLVNLAELGLPGVVMALHEIEALLGYDSLDVEFAIDKKGQVHILQVRPIAVDHTTSMVDDDICNTFLTAAHQRWQALETAPPHLLRVAPLYGVMPDWNPAEIIGTTPGKLASSLYSYLVMDEIWATQRYEYGYRDVRPAPLMVMFAGKPYVDVRASFASFLPSELPDDLASRLLDFYLNWLRAHPELHDKVEFDVVPTCMAFNFNRWEERLKKDGGFSDENVAKLRDGLRNITKKAIRRPSEDLVRIDELSSRFNIIMTDDSLVPLERARLLLDDCKRLGTLPFAHLARGGFIAMTLLREAETTGVISKEAHDDFLSSLRTVSHELTVDAQQVANEELDWEVFVARYGHLRPGTYDIASPCYDSDPERFLRPLVGHSHEANIDSDSAEAWIAERDKFCASFGKLGLHEAPDQIEAFMRQAIEGREYAKFIFSRNLSAALESLAEVGNTYSLNRAEIANLSLEELFALRNTSFTDEEITRHLSQQSEKENRIREVAVACELPPLITRESDLDFFVIGGDHPNFVGVKTVTAHCLDLRESTMDNNVSVCGKIILIPQADPGYDWLFGQKIAGLVTLYGGANSHMAIRAAEFGLPAAIGVGEQRYRELIQASVIELAPRNKLLRVVR